MCPDLKPHLRAMGPWLIPAESEEHALALVVSMLALWGHHVDPRADLEVAEITQDHLRSTVSLWWGAGAFEGLDRLYAGLPGIEGGGT